MGFASYRTMTQCYLRKDCVTIFGHFTGRILIGCKILCLITKQKKMPDTRRLNSTRI